MKDVKTGFGWDVTQPGHGLVLANAQQVSASLPALPAARTIAIINEEEPLAPLASGLSLLIFAAAEGWRSAAFASEFHVSY